MRKTKIDRQIEARIEEAYRTSCAGLQINILDIPKVFRRGRELIAQGVDNGALGAGLREFVTTELGGQ